jgi:predicted RNase H-like HicB family nuclease
MMMAQQAYTIAIYEGESDEGGYWCEVLGLPGCVAQGETLDELRDNIPDAIQAWEETMAEPFLGSGTTAIAAANRGRKCYGMEISPAYAQVSIERLAAHIDAKPKKLK